MCPEYLELASNVDSILVGLTELTRAQVRLSRADDDPASQRLAVEIERATAELEQANYALLQHVADHKCHGTEVR